MTFAEFQATGRDSADIGAELSFDDGGVKAVGRIYADAYYIDSTDNWDEEYRRKRWHLLIDRSEYFANDLAELERRLWLYALGEDKNARDRLVEDAINAAAKSIQDALGQTDGGVAGHFFSGADAEGIRTGLDDYIFAEIING